MTCYVHNEYALPKNNEDLPGYISLINAVLGVDGLLVCDDLCTWKCGKCGFFSGFIVEAFLFKSGNEIIFSLNIISPPLIFADVLRGYESIAHGLYVRLLRAFTLAEPKMPNGDTVRS